MWLVRSSKNSIWSKYYQNCFKSHLVFLGSTAPGRYRHVPQWSNTSFYLRPCLEPPNPFINPKHRWQDLSLYVWHIDRQVLLNDSVAITSTSSFSFSWSRMRNWKFSFHSGLHVVPRALLVSISFLLCSLNFTKELGALFTPRHWFNTITVIAYRW